jgi:hypothetical protein
MTDESPQEVSGPGMYFCIQNRGAAKIRRQER